VVACGGRCYSSIAMTDGDYVMNPLHSGIS
jgi:hypothetical protein